MTSPQAPCIPPPPVWDLFCAVVDNLGDIGVAWRLARQLADEHAVAVRLWVDDLHAFARLCPSLDPALQEQTPPGATQVSVRLWADPPPECRPGEVVIELFGCRLPPAFETAMAGRTPPPVWINLEYLSAEPWVEDCHGLPSSHPRLPLRKYFIYPGFTARTGGLLREHDLIGRRHAFEADPARQAAAEARFGLPSRRPEGLRVSVFCYPCAPLEAWTQALLGSPKPVDILLPEGVPGDALTMRISSPPARSASRGAACGPRLLSVPFVPQPDYDSLLWLSDLNIVRGEDSFVRAQWAARPFIWHIYPQEDGVHLAKLTAFLDRYLASAPPGTASAIRALMLAWNTGENLPAAWRDMLPHLDAWKTHARRWADTLAAMPDLCSTLARFVAGRL